ncbi:MAG: carbohydrate kinase family protein [bacterium]|uniref:Carbohydrate kinase family protein n=1 Tax=Candidatus Infernicultor aquiphilus TaxID=1805029 RepID=A0A2M7KAS9_9BACT|nr:carbohydrate kinase family protein [bacterium]PIW11439.1 MAG: carbohydrate kinase family protein [Candidatus Atribacteria bacterium CG17_big_fil_post_rev_8_21_14_2_50_34_11]PIX35238.1 MAG: carbohydrate kinase family protein [Candidatus Atribacteria bacterium CG_4_8_14_3_um_filter_34_18]
MDIVVAGHICLDIIPDWRIGSIKTIIPGHILEMSGLKLSTGGAVANTGIALKKLGISTALLGKVGTDAFGKVILEILKKEGKTLAENMIISGNEVSSYTIVLNPPDTDRVFLHYPGPNHTFTANDIPYEKIKSSRIFHFGYPPLMQKFYENDGKELVKMFQRIRKMKIITSLDMAMPDPESPAGRVDWFKFFKNVLPLVDIFMPSIDELLYMLRPEKYNKIYEKRERFDMVLLNQLAKQLIDYGTKVVAIKLGDQGLYLRTHQIEKSNLSSIINHQDWNYRQLLSPCFAAEVKGTTGTGDATIAGFLAELLKGGEPEKCITLATAVGACCVEAVDATEGIRPLPEIIKRVTSGWERLSLSIPLDHWKFDYQYKIWKGPEDQVR